jgi:hypothetical protein
MQGRAGKVGNNFLQGVGEVIKWQLRLLAKGHGGFLQGLKTVKTGFFGPIGTAGKRTVTFILRIMGRVQQPGSCKYHRRLSQANWSARPVHRLLLRQLVDTFYPLALSFVFGLEETLKRHWASCT